MPVSSPLPRSRWYSPTLFADMAEKRAPARVRDMTEGSPLRLILAFAVPLFIGNIFQQVYSMVDTMVVGYHLGDSAIAAIGATSSLYSLVINFAGGLNNGYGIVVTQRFGSHDRKEMKQAIAGMMLLDVVVTLLLTALSLAFLRPLMRFMNTPEALFDQSYAYISVICGGMLATMGYNMFASILRAMGNSRSPLYFLILSCILNIGLDLLFVVVFEWGISGGAIATVLAQLVSAVACGIFVLSNYRDYLPGREDFRVPMSMLSTLFSTGFSMALMSSLVDGGSVIFQRANNVLGEIYITAHAAARKILVIMLQPQATIAVATSTFVGQNWGAKNGTRVQAGLKRSLVLELGWGLFGAAFVWLFGSWLVRFTTGTSDPEIIRNTVLSLRIQFTLFPFLGVLFCLRNAMQAMGQKIVPVLSSCIELAMKILSANLLIPTLGFLGTCVTEPCTWVLMVVFLFIVYLSKRKKLFAALQTA